MLESQVSFEEVVEERQARIDLSQSLEETDLEETNLLSSASNAVDVEFEEMGADEFSEALLVAEEVEEVVELEADVKASEISEDIIADIFKMSGVLPKDSKRGRHTTWSPKFIHLCVQLLSSGETAASVFNFFSILSKFYPELLGQGKRVPSVMWFQRLRDALPFLNSLHTRDVILKAGRLFLACDGAAMNDCSKSLALGILSESGKLHLLDIQKSEGGTGEAIASQMKALWK